jgi:hypothetical protein
MGFCTLKRGTYKPLTLSHKAWQRHLRYSSEKPKFYQNDNYVKYLTPEMTSDHTAMGLPSVTSAVILIAKYSSTNYLSILI